MLGPNRLRTLLYSELFLSYCFLTYDCYSLVCHQCEIDCEAYPCTTHSNCKNQPQPCPSRLLSKRPTPTLPQSPPIQEANATLPHVASYPRGQRQPCPSRLLSKRPTPTLPQLASYPKRPAPTLPQSPPIQQFFSKIPKVIFQKL